MFRDSWLRKEQRKLLIVMFRMSITCSSSFSPPLALLKTNERTNTHKLFFNELSPAGIRAPADWPCHHPEAGGVHRQPMLRLLSFSCAYAFPDPAWVAPPYHRHRGGDPSWSRVSCSSAQGFMFSFFYVSSSLLFSYDPCGRPPIGVTMNYHNPVGTTATIRSGCSHPRRHLK